MPSMPSMLPTHPGSYMFLFRTGVIQRGRSLSCSRIVQGRLGRSFTRSEGRRRFRRDRAGTRGSRGRGRGRNAPGHPYEVGDKRRTRTCDRCQERPLDCVEQSEVEVLRSRSAGIAIFRYFDPCGPSMWVGTGCGSLSQASATISAPVQDARGGTTPLAEAVGARPDRRCHGGHREDPRKPLDDVLPGTHRATLPTSPAAGLPTGHFGCHVHNFIKWTWQPLIP